MPNAAPLQSMFNSGELSPYFYGHTEHERYKSGAALLLNYLPIMQGALTRRPGTGYIGTCANSASATRITKFKYQDTLAYGLEFSDLNIRVYRDRGAVLNVSTPVDIVSPYAEADLFDLKFTQSADTFYITHKDYPAYQLTRTSHTAWTLAAVTFIDGPYLHPRVLGHTITALTTGAIAGGGSGNVASDHDTFVSTDVGRFIRLEGINGAPTGWTYLLITAFINAQSVTATNMGTTTAATSRTIDGWRLGLYSETTGYPRTCVFHENRLGFLGPRDYTSRGDLSVTDEHTNFEPTQTDDGSVDATDAVSFTLSANGANAIYGASSDEKGLILTTYGGDWLVSGTTDDEAISPTSIKARQSSAVGSADVQPLKYDKSHLFLSRSKQKLHEVSFFYNSNGFETNDISVLSEHLLQGGLRELARVQEPNKIMWAPREEDGKLIGMTYERDSESLRVGWHQHELGGVGDAAGNIPVVESCVDVPSPDGFSDDLYLVVNRYINGATVRYIEYVSEYFNHSMEQSEAMYLDCALTFDTPLTVLNIILTDPTKVQIQITAHGLVDGDKILITDVEGSTELNTNTYLVDATDANLFYLKDLSGNYLAASAVSSYVADGTVRKMVQTITGLDHLEGEEVGVVGDGAVQTSQTVSSGSITLVAKAAVVHVGYRYSSRGKLLPFDAGSANGTAIGKTQRTHRVGFLLYRSGAIAAGTNFDRLDDMVSRSPADLLSRAVPLFTGVKSIPLDNDYEFGNQICWEQTEPVPGTILAITPQLVTQDRG